MPEAATFFSWLSPLLMMMSQNDCGSDVFMVKSCTHSLHYNNNCCTPLLFFVSMTTPSQARRALLNRHCSMLALSVFNSHSEIIFPPLFFVSTSLSHFSQLLPPFCSSEHCTYRPEEMTGVDKRCVYQRERSVIIDEPPSPYQSFVISDAGH